MSSSSTPHIRFSRVELAAREQIEIVDQPRHARIVAVGLLRLEREAFGQVARADAGRVEASGSSPSTASTRASGTPSRSAMSSSDTVR